MKAVFEFLDRVRESGRINMFAAAPLLEQAFGISRNDARLVLQEWMKTYGERHGSNQGSH